MSKTHTTIAITRNNRTVTIDMRHTGRHMAAFEERLLDVLERRMGRATPGWDNGRWNQRDTYWWPGKTHLHVTAAAPWDPPGEITLYTPRGVWRWIF